MSHNYSLYSIPAYIVLAMVPHVYSITLLSRHKKRWDNVSPRSQKFASALQKSIPPDCLAKYERSRAAHNNMMENMAYVIGAVLAGNMVKLNAGFMNKSMALYFVTRMAYLVSYIQTEKLHLSHLRSMIYTTGVVVLSVIYFKAAGVLASES
jgi:uncharacterized MAPEG superfamily protein